MKPAPLEDEAEKRRFEEATAGITDPFLLEMERKAPGIIAATRAMLRRHAEEERLAEQSNKGPLQK